jgi:polyhydroxyalkanoate synthesis repressor PhaR
MSSIVVTIKKYGNRRLYDTSASRYLNLEELAAMIRDGATVRVVDAKTEEDLTPQVLGEVVLKSLGGAELIPTSMLHRIIRSTGDDPWQAMMREQLKTGLALVSVQMDQVEAMLRPGQQAPRAPDAPEPDPEPPPRASDDELDALRARLAELEERLEQ